MLGGEMDLVAQLQHGQSVRDEQTEAMEHQRESQIHRRLRARARYRSWCPLRCRYSQGVRRSPAFSPFEPNDSPLPSQVSSYVGRCL